MTAEPTPFELDMAAQPDALRAFASAPVPGLERIVDGGWERIVFTGMGSSLYAAHPSWRALTALGLPVWNVDAGSLLDSPELLTKRTLLVATSQSGGSGEVVQLLQGSGAAARRPGHVLGITADDASPLAGAADTLLLLRSGEEATVSTKSYLNTLAAHRALVAAFRGEDPGVVAAEIAAAADVAGATLLTEGVDRAAREALAPESARFVTIGRGDAAATAKYASLIVKESAKIQIEGYVGGQFRHGPYELAGPGLTAFVFGSLADGPGSLRSLAVDTAATGARVVAIGGQPLADAQPLGPVDDGAPRPGLHRLVADAVVAQLLALRLAEANGVTPGEFVFGSKVTAAM